MASLDDIRRELAAGRDVRLRVKVTPKAGRCGIAGFLADGTLKVRVLAAPERGKANAEVCGLLARELGLPAGRVSVAAGVSSPAKTLLIKA